MQKRRVLWLLCMAGLSLVLYTIVVSRAQSRTDVIFGGVEGAYVQSNGAAFYDPNTVPTPEPTEDIWPQIDINLTQYSMVNEDNLLSPRYTPDVDVISTTSYMLFSTVAMPSLDALIEDMQNHGFNVYVAGAYRSYSYQETLFNGKATQIALGMGIPDGDNMYMDPRYQDAVAEAKTITAFPGASEHQLGLAVDLMDRPYNKLIYDNMNHAFFEYLDSICANYGFIKRYPTRKLLLTGWDEPWHYRYVGQEAAKFIMDNGICYEEFYAHYVPDFRY